MWLCINSEFDATNIFRLGQQKSGKVVNAVWKIQQVNWLINR